MMNEEAQKNLKYVLDFLFCCPKEFANIQFVANYGFKKFIDKMNSLKNLFPDKKNEIQKMTEDVLAVSKVKVVSGKKEKDKKDSFKR